MSDLGTLLEELRAMRADQKGDAEKLHKRINEVREAQIEMQAQFDTLPCSHENSRITKLEARAAEIEDAQEEQGRQLKQVAVVSGAIGTAIGSAGSLGWSWMRTKLGW